MVVYLPARMRSGCELAPRLTRRGYCSSPAGRSRSCAVSCFSRKVPRVFALGCFRRLTHLFGYHVADGEVDLVVLRLERGLLSWRASHSQRLVHNPAYGSRPGRMFIWVHGGRRR